jgi:formate dehydrogenase beta subunit
LRACCNAAWAWRYSLATDPDIANPAYFHKVVDCQYACPAHTPVPEYIRLIAQGRYSDAYMVNWVSNVFPGILGRTCDRPCEPACRRGRVEEANAQHPEPVAICRLKRVAADMKDDVGQRMPRPAQKKNGKRVACIGAGPASLTVARDLAPLGYDVTVYDGEAKAGGFIRTQIPRFRLPESVIDEETGYILDLGVTFKSGERIESMKALMAQGYDAVFVGCGAPRGRDLQLPGRKEAAASIHIGIDWLASCLVRPYHAGGQAGHRAGWGQHGHGLLPLGAAPGRHRREGHRAQWL